MVFSATKFWKPENLFPSIVLRTIKVPLSYTLRSHFFPVVVVKVLQQGSKFWISDIKIYRPGNGLFKFVSESRFSASNVFETIAEN